MLCRFMKFWICCVDNKAAFHWEKRGYDMETFKVGDRIYAEEDFVYGRIVETEEDVAHVEFRTSGSGGVCHINCQS